MAESVWDYPRPPVVEETGDRVRVEHAGITVADSVSALRVLETTSPPTIYIPPTDVRTELLGRSGGGGTYCEWKGPATYFDLRAGDAVVERAAWTYEDPRPGFEAIRDHLAFFAGRVDRCLLGDEVVTPQPGGFYGGWITSGIEGPFKGEPGTEGW